MNKLQGSFKK